MAALAMIVGGVEAWILPLVGLLLLVVSKVTAGETARMAGSFFLAVLVISTLVTFRTMLAGETIWLLHALTMAIFIVGAVSMPAASGAKRIA